VAKVKTTKNIHSTTYLRDPEGDGCEVQPKRGPPQATREPRLAMPEA
jgi:hypothetical protein